MRSVTEKDLDAIIEWYNNRVSGKFVYYIGDGNIRNGKPLARDKY